MYMYMRHIIIVCICNNNMSTACKIYSLDSARIGRTKLLHWLRRHRSARVSVVVCGSVAPGLWWLGKWNGWWRTMWWRGTWGRGPVRTWRRRQIPQRSVSVFGAIFFRIIVNLGLAGRLGRRRSVFLVRRIRRGARYYLLCRLLRIHWRLICARRSVLKQFSITPWRVHQVYIHHNSQVIEPK